MIRGLYIATTGMKANVNRIDTVSNNMANAQTIGFKKEDAYMESFKDVLIAKYNGSSIPAEGAFDGVKVEKEVDDAFVVTTKVGYIQTQTEEGVSYNKSAKFRVNEDGYLSTIYYNSDRTIDKKLGNLILGKDGQPIKVEPGTRIDVSDSGEILVGGNAVGSLIVKTGPNIIGTMNSGIQFKRLVTDFQQGNIIPTESPLDMALTSPGFFKINTPAGMMYTRNGAFKLNANLEMVTNEGYRVQGINGDIKLTSNKFTMNEFGEISVDGAIVDKIKTVDFANKGDLEKIGTTFFRIKNEAKAAEEQYKGTVLNGALEQSNAETVTEMIKLMNLYREYESNQKIVKAFDETLAKAATEVGRVG